MRKNVRAELTDKCRQTNYVWSYLFCGLVLSLLLSGSPVFAQSVKSKADTKGKEKPKKPVVEEMKIERDPDALPPGFQPPPDPLEIMKLVKPLATKEELDKLKKEHSNFAKVRNECDLSPSGKATIEASIRYRIVLLSRVMADERKDGDPPPLFDMQRIHRAFVDEIAPPKNPVKSAQQIKEMSDFINNEVVKQIPVLLKNNFYVRLHAVMILSEIDYANAHVPLLLVVQAKDIGIDKDDGQPASVKIAATNGLMRILQFSNPQPPVKDRTAIALAIVEELKNATHHWWFQMRLIEALRHCDISGVDAGNNSHPFVVDSLMGIIADKTRSPIVRAKACNVLGRVPLPAGTKPTDAVDAVASFALELSKAAAEKPNNPIWKSCFWDVYLAFKPANSKELDAEKKIAAGLLSRLKALAQPAYSAIVPIVSDIINGKPPNAADVLKLNSVITPTPKE